MSADRKEIKGLEPVGSRLPSFLPPIYRDFFTNMLEGKYKSPTPAQIEEAVSHHFSFEPLTPLTTSEELELQSDMLGQYNFALLGNEGWKELSGDICLTSERGGLAAGDVGKKIGSPVLSSQEKEVLLTDPEFYQEARIQVGNFSMSVLGNGTRHLTEEMSPSKDTYPMTKSDFFRMVGTIRQSQGKNTKDTLQGLDIGGSTGLAAHDAERMDPNLHMTNITISPELGMWPLRGGHTMVLAERMPKDYFEQYDFIISNMAFRYFRFPEVALNNALLALKAGGIMLVSFSGSRSPLINEDREDEMNQRINDQFEMMDHLQTDGVIEFFQDDKYYHARDTYEKGGLDGEYRKKRDRYGVVYLQKKVSFR